MTARVDGDVIDVYLGFKVVRLFCDDDTDT